MQNHRKNRTGYGGKIKKHSHISFLCLIFSTLLLLIILSGCECNHEWTEATCSAPQRCKKCGETQGDALGHSWIDATCTKASYCERCGLRTGEPLGHTPDEWIVDTPATCTEKGEQHGTCSVCGETVTEEIAALNPDGHTPSEWVTTKAATCTEKGERQTTCSVCNQIAAKEEIPALGHNFIDDKIITYATPDTSGTKQQKCSNCGQTQNISYLLSTQEKENISAVKSWRFKPFPNLQFGDVCESLFNNIQWIATDDAVIFKGNIKGTGASSAWEIKFKVSGSGFSLSQISQDDVVYTDDYDIYINLYSLYSVASLRLS